MESEEFKTSGLLESYALGLASEEEKKLVEDMLSTYPELREELNSVYQSLENYALTFSREAPVKLKSKVSGRINQIQEEGAAKTTPVIPFAKKKTNLRFPLAASVTLFIMSAAFNFLLYSKWQKAEDRTIALEKEKEVIAGEFSIQKADYHRLSGDYNLMIDPANRMIVMKGTESHLSMNSIVFWNSVSHEVFVNVTSLPEPPQGKQYQLWALKAGKPIDAGVFDFKKSLQKMKKIESADAFAVTLEDFGGKPSPSLDQLYVIANI